MVQEMDLFVLRILTYVVKGRVEIHTLIHSLHDGFADFELVGNHMLQIRGRDRHSFQISGGKAPDVFAQEMRDITRPITFRTGLKAPAVTGLHT